MARITLHALVVHVALSTLRCSRCGVHVARSEFKRLLAVCGSIFVARDKRTALSASHFASRSPPSAIVMMYLARIVRPHLGIILRPPRCSCAKNAHIASSKEVAAKLWEMAIEYRDEAAKFDGARALHWGTSTPVEQVRSAH